MTEALSTRLRALAEPGQIPMKPETRALLLAAAEVAEIEAFVQQSKQVRPLLSLSPKKFA